jgi:uncharacterized protein YqfA (UPF0365 family)
MVGAGVPLRALWGMRMRGVPVRRIVETHRRATAAGLEAPLDVLEAHVVLGGRIEEILDAMIAADRAGLVLEFAHATAIELCGRDPRALVELALTPRVVGTPRVTAVARDGVALRASALVTLRARIPPPAGAAGEATALARVAEALAGAIAAADSHRGVYEQREAVGRAALARRLDAGTGCEILSIELTDLEAA